MENKLIKINLNQTLNRFELAEIKEDRKRWLVFGIIAIFIVSVISFNYLISSLNEDLIELKLDEINRLNTETLIIQQEYNKQREIREQLSSEETLLTSFSFENLEEGYVEVLYDIESERIFIAPLLEALAYDIPEDMSISDITYDYGKKEFEINLISENDAAKYVETKDILDRNIENNFILILEEQDGPGWNYNLQEKADASAKYKKQQYLHTRYVINKEAN